MNIDNVNNTKKEFIPFRPSSTCTVFRPTNTSFCNTDDEREDLISFKALISSLPDLTLTACGRDILEWHKNGILAVNATFKEVCNWIKTYPSCCYLTIDNIEKAILCEITRRQVIRSFGPGIKSGMIVWFIDEENDEPQKCKVTFVTFDRNNRLSSFCVNFLDKHDVEYDYDEFEPEALNDNIFFSYNDAVKVLNILRTNKTN